MLFPASAPYKRRAIFYIDGFNLLYGAVKDTPYDDLSVEEHCRRLHPLDDLVAVKYFTTLVLGRTQPNQRMFWRALSTTPVVEIKQGRLRKTRKWTVNTRAVSFRGTGYSGTISEKRTDVNIGITMVDDAYQNACDNLVLLSGDSDLVPAVELVRNRLKDKKIFVYAPTSPIPGRACLRNL